MDHRARVIHEDALWDLVEKWRKQAQTRATGPFLSSLPPFAWAQAMNEAAEDLSNLIIDY